MSKIEQVKVPDIGDFDKVPVIEILVSEGDTVEAEDSLVTLESDKATMEVPSPFAGKVKAINVAEGDEVGEGDLIAEVEVVSEDSEEDAEEGDSGEEKKKGSGESSGDSEDTDGSGDSGRGDEARPETGNRKPETDHSYDCDLLVLGAGPGGYTAAFRAADLGLDVVLVERYPALGGVCLNVGCIPSKALLHVGRVIDEAAGLENHGVAFGRPEISLDKLREFKDKTVKQLTDGLTGLARKRKVRVVQGTGRFADANTMTIEGAPGVEQVTFSRCIIAAGSRVMKLDGIPWDDDRVMDSTDALELAEIPGRMLVIGGGIIGLEMACVYRALGARVTVVELMDQLMPGADRDLVKPLQKHLEKTGVDFYLKTKVTGVEAAADSLKVSLEGSGAPDTAEYDRVLVAVGRRPNGDQIDASAAGVEVDDKGFVQTDGSLRTSAGHILAIGDIIGQPMLAHKGSYEGKVAAEVVAGHKRAADARAIPSVAYTDPEVAWVGLTETQAREEGLDYGVGKFPWAASGRAIGMGRTEGFTKLIFDNKTSRLLGGGIVGPHAGDLITELVLAIEMGADAADIGLTIHPHPTLSESVMMAAEMFEGTITDLYAPKKKKR